jgi:hypothetical protein
MIPHPPSPAEIDANATLVAAELLAHPAALLMPSPAVAALAAIAVRERPGISEPERRLLAQALELAREVENRLSMEARP